LKKTIIKNCFLFLLVILLSIKISGGVEKKKYKALVRKPKSIITTYYLYDYSKESAKENLALNGWEVLKIEELPIESSNEDLIQKGFFSPSYKLRLLKIFYFEKGAYSFNVDNETISLLKKLKKGKKYYLYGHTDSLPVIPNDKFKNNYELSILRANFVKGLVKKYSGIDENVYVVGFDAFYPIESNSFDGSKKNRRVELYESD